MLPIKKMVFLASIPFAIAAIGFTGSSGYMLYEKQNDPAVLEIEKDINIKVPAYYSVWPSDAIRFLYAIKAGIFWFDPTETKDGIYRKDWMPLAFDRCLLLKKNNNAFSKDTDVDNDGIPDNIDPAPYDFSNGNPTLRSNSGTFDQSSIGNNSNYGPDINKNGIPDIYEGSCFGLNPDSQENRKLIMSNEISAYDSNPDKTKSKIRDKINSFASYYNSPKIPNDKLDILVNKTYETLSVTEEAIVEYGKENFLLEKSDILSNLSSSSLKSWSSK